MYLPKISSGHLSIVGTQNLFSLASVDHFGFYPAVANQIHYEGITGLTGRGQPSFFLSSSLTVLFCSGAS